MPSLIPNWKKAWKFVSMQGMVLGLTVQGVWATLPDDWRASVPTWGVAALTIICLVVGVVGRLVAQKGTEHDATPPTT